MEFSSDIHRNDAHIEVPNHIRMLLQDKDDRIEHLEKSNIYLREQLEQITQTVNVPQETKIYQSSTLIEHLISHWCRL